MGTILIESNRNSVDPNAFLEENYVCNYDLYKIRLVPLEYIFNRKSLDVLGPPKRNGELQGNTCG